MNKADLENAVLSSFRGEIEAFKPGNVSVYAEGHDMTVKDFIVSAEVSTPILCQSGTGLGHRVLTSVKATREAVGCNTNLGMLLLFTPIIMAAESGFNDINSLRHNLEVILNSLTQNDAAQVYEAIRIANPGGLGNSDTQDVNKEPDCSLKYAMELASQRDSIALQYTNNFKEVFDMGFASIKCFDNSWNSVKWSTVSCYLMFMSSFADSHIQRKYGVQIAEIVREKSEVITEKFHKASEPEAVLVLSLLREFDEELKADGYNPGTCADLTAASILVYTLCG
jgi:triphosphoribosyl-dephospho-CoA synthase